jgi:hypothetical protein
VINGGFFAHNARMQADDGAPVGQPGVGRPVGPTSHRSDPLPVPHEYAQDYGSLTVGGDVGLSSGPLLAHEGRPTNLDDRHDRFQYRLNSPEEGLEENPRNTTAGVLTHASDPNARAAMSIRGDDVYLQTATPPAAAFQQGVTMTQWQTMTQAGAGISDDSGGSILNLDGGGSVFMGITQEGGVREIVRGGRPGEGDIRPVGNIIASRPTR